MNASSKANRHQDPGATLLRRARRRLIGAALIAVIVAIGVPLILDPQPAKLPSDLLIEIPDKGAQALSHPEPLPTAPIAAQPSASSATSSSDDQADRVKPSEPVEPVQPVEPPKKSETVDASKTLAPAKKPEKAETPKTAVSPKPTELLKPAEPVKKPEPEKSKGRVALQVGAYASSAKAEDVKAQLQQAGLSAYAEKVSTSGGDRWRVRVGPFSSDRAADAAKGRLALAGFDGRLVPLESK